MNAYLHGAPIISVPAPRHATERLHRTCVKAFRRIHILVLDWSTKSFVHRGRRPRSWFPQRVVKLCMFRNTLLRAVRSVCARTLHVVIRGGASLSVIPWKPWPLAAWLVPFCRDSIPCDSLKRVCAPHQLCLSTVRPRLEA